MENSSGPSTMRNMYSGKHNSLPPKSPFPSIASFYTDYIPNTTSGSKGTIPKYRDINSLHQRTSSESRVMEEQPSWLDELLDEPETPVKRGHRRSSSDSFTYMEAANANIEYAAQVEYRLRNMNSPPSWGSKAAQNRLFYAEQNNTMKTKNRNWDSPPKVLARSNSTTASRDGFALQNSTSSDASQEVSRINSTTTEKQDAIESCTPGASTERNDFSNAKASETDTKRSKQQFAQRSRVRKLQYIAELERNVQALEAEGSEVSGELKFLNQRSLILTMENKALKQRLENLAQEQLIKYCKFLNMLISDLVCVL
ncbi:Basic-leucine zipper domain-containing protein [Artemisia annua]|uniref:Basic-leucine zipper domain-containing protein n=1 Tax=Artemisia annua TaxID=35608 RepID=A0A2U1MBQ5_ARTAN|nr:Basic-leucine zipper domain-containing protein [Artemisia annua]